MQQNFQLDFYATLLCLVLILLIGRFFIKKFKILRDFNIPEPVVGGLIAAIFLTTLSYFKGYSFNFDASFKEPLMLAFYSSIGLSADFSSLKKGGRILVIFLVAVSAMLVLQDALGVGIAVLMGQNPILGLLGGSITMSGGHGTGAAWANTFVNDPYHFSAAMEAAMAAATFGLIAGGIIGGPVARYLVKRHKLELPNIYDKEVTPFEKPEKERKITASSFSESLALISVCLFLGVLLHDFFSTESFNLPTFVYCLFVGAILRNTLQLTRVHSIFDREISILGNVSLSLFLVFALMTIDLSKLVDLAVPMTVILILQVVLMVIFAIFVTFRVCGKDYDAAVLSAGHCGFGLGATPTAIANMQAVTQNYGVSHMAFIVVPLVGAFFIDIVNALVIAGFLNLPIF